MYAAVASRGSYERRLRASLPALVTVGIQGFNSLSNLVISWLLIRAIGVAGFGYYAVYLMIAVNVTAVTNAFLIQPLNSIASRFSRRRQEEFIYAVGLGQLGVVALMVLLAAIGCAIASLASFPVLPVIATAAYSIFLTPGEFLRRIAFFRRDRISVIRFDTIRYVLIGIAYVVPARLIKTPDAEDFTISLAASYILAIAVMRLWTRHSKKLHLSRRAVLCHMRRIARSGKWLAGSAFLSFANTHSVIFISFFVVGAYEAGLVRLAQTIVGLANPAIQAMEHLIPVRVGLCIREKGQAAALVELRKLSVATLAAFCALYVAVIIASPIALRIMGVHGGMTAIWLICGFCLIYLMTVLTSLVIFAVRAREQAHLVSKSMIWSTLIAIVIAYPSVLAFGVFGIIVCAVATQVVAVSILAIHVSRQKTIA